MKKLYFAYGSNLSKQQMLERCPNSQQLGKARLKKYRLCFDDYAERWKGGVATIIPDRSSFVDGIVYSLSEECEKNLDSIEMPPYQKIEVALPEYKREKVYTYQKDLTETKPPSLPYLTNILWGYRDFDLDLSILEKALLESKFIGEAIFLETGDSRKDILSKVNHRVPAHLKLSEKETISGDLYYFHQKSYLNSAFNTIELSNRGSQEKKLGFFAISNLKFKPAWYYRK